MADKTGGYTDELLEHDADGIQEYDNPSPDWLVYLFYVTIAFALGYLIYYGFNLGPSAQVAYLQESKGLEKEWADYYAKNPIQPPTTVELVAAAQNPAMIQEGREQFTKTCSSCHGEQAGGLIGPNLTDDHWLHGGKLTQIYTTLVNGVPAKGMPPWGRALSPEKLTTLTAYIRSIQGSSPSNPKAAQGVKVEPDPI